MQLLCTVCVCWQAWMLCRTHSGNVLVREEDFTFPHSDIYSVDFTHLTNQMRCFKTLLYLLNIYIPHLDRKFGKGRSFEEVTGKWVDELPVCRTQTDQGTNRPKLPFAVRLTNEGLASTLWWDGPYSNICTFVVLHICWVHKRLRVLELGRF